MQQASSAPLQSQALLPSHMIQIIPSHFRMKYNRNRMGRWSAMDNYQTIRMSREHRTLEAMIRIYCRGQHGKAKRSLCPECEVLAAYAHQRLNRCPFQESKTTCANCPVHCYKTDMREKVRGVMKYAGPRMAYQHPLLALFHFVDGFRKNPQRLNRP